MDAIFKALNDPHRRAILDALRDRDGQTLGEIEARFAMTRFGVMAHLRVLEEAGLVIPRRSGRFKHHYLNALPLQEVIDRWIEPLLKPALRGVIDLKATLEGDTSMTTDGTRPDFVHQTFIRAPAARVWEALLDGAMTRRYYFGTTVEGEAVAGGKLVWRGADGAPLLSSRVIESDPPRRLDLSFEPHWFGPGAPASRNVFVLAEEAGLTSLTIEHYGVPPGQEGVKEGWARIAAGLKTLLETGQPLVAEMA